MRVALRAILKSMLPFARAFRHRDFRLMWAGAFLSFTGSFVQNIAQGWLVYELTGDVAKLALVTFCGMAPVAVLGPFAGTLADTLDKRKVLIASQLLFASGALFLAYMTATAQVEYWHVVSVALMFGSVGALEMPTRQSILSRVVPHEDLAAAVPLNAMTFNFARLVGPAIGGAMLAAFGPQTCYLINGVSYLFMISAVIAVRTDLSAIQREPQPISDLMLEGMRYTFKDQRLRTLFVMELITSGCGLVYIALIPAIAKDMLGLDKQGLGWAMATIGLGAISGLALMTVLSDRKVRSLMVRLSMVFIGVGLISLALVRSPMLAFPLLAIIGGSVIIQFNTTNTLFQLLSPDHLRGRVLSMHIWAIAGLGPFGILFFGWLAGATQGNARLPLSGIPLALSAGGLCVLLGAAWGWKNRARLTGVE